MLTDVSLSPRADADGCDVITELMLTDVALSSS